MKAAESPPGDAAPELLFRREEEMLIQLIGSDRYLHPFAAAGDDREPAVLALVTHMLCWSWAMYFSAAALRVRPRQHELGLVDRPGPCHHAVEGGRHEWR